MDIYIYPLPVPHGGADGDPGWPFVSEPTTRNGKPTESLNGLSVTYSRYRGTKGERDEPDVRFKHLNSANPSIQLAGEWAGLLQVRNKDLVLLVQNDVIALLGPEVITSSGQEIPGRDLVISGIGSGEGGTIDGKLDKTRSDRSGRVVLDLDVLRNLNERSDDLAIKL